MRCQYQYTKLRVHRVFLKPVRRSLQSTIISPQLLSNILTHTPQWPAVGASGSVSSSSSWPRWPPGSSPPRAKHKRYGEAPSLCPSRRATSCGQLPSWRNYILSSNRDVVICDPNLHTVESRGFMRRPCRYYCGLEATAYRFSKRLDELEAFCIGIDIGIA